MSPTLSERTDLWREHRPAVFGAAYRLLGSVADAEDVVQDTWLKASGTDLDAIDDLRAWLVTVAARRSYDIITSARARRESYVGPWLPEPLATGPDAAEPVLVDDSVSTAMLIAMEHLSPDERLATVLHGVFDFSYDRIGALIGRSPAATRQLASRARRRMAENRPPATGPSVTDPATRDPGRTATDAAAVTAAPSSGPDRARALAAFKAAYDSGDVAALVGLLHPDVVYVTDGGGKAYAARRPILGAAKVARVIVAVAARRAPMPYVPAELNGLSGFVGRRGDRVVIADAFTVVEGRITRIDRVVNPEKLSHLR